MREIRVVGPFARKQRITLVVFYACCAIFAITAALIVRFSGILRLLAGTAAIGAAVYGLLSLYQFFKTTDEVQQAINYRAIEFAFIGSLLASVAIALLRSFGIHDPSPYLIPAVMVALWSVGLFFSSRRFE
jgi:hypothetical protein